MYGLLRYLKLSFNPVRGGMFKILSKFELIHCHRKKVGVGHKILSLELLELGEVSSYGLNRVSSYSISIKTKLALPIIRITSR